MGVIALTPTPTRIKKKVCGWLLLFNYHIVGFVDEHHVINEI